jgi:hypothetical protein
LNIVVKAVGLGTAAFVMLSRRNPLWALAAGPVVNIVAAEFG